MYYTVTDTEGQMSQNIEWGQTNKTKLLVEKLDELIPLEGRVTNPVKNKHLEKFRKAQNVVYDIFNNGLMNRGKALKVLGLMKYDLFLDEYNSRGELLWAANWNKNNEVVERAFTPIVMAAAKEQGVI
tara:strand:+ start:1177 stop:1560 length:384 start_codon:yes stop_codon:yes gene_type:complete